MKENIPTEIIEKYLTGNCSDTERIMVEQWYAGKEQENDFISGLPASQKEYIKNNLLSQIKKNIKEIEQEPVSPSADAKIIQMPAVATKNNSWAFYAVKVAAVLVMVLGMGLIGIDYWSEPAPAIAVEAPAVFQNEKKLVKKITLQDGSRVWLQENSTLTVADDFNQNQRRVTLVGEAFFEVAKDKNRPFEICSGKVKTRVLGTSFNIKAYEKDATVEVSVVTGRVSVLMPEGGKKASDYAGQKVKAQAPIILLPNQKVTYSKNKENQVEKETSVNGRRIVWAKASLSFTDTPIRQVVQTLNRNFATDIKLANVNLNNCSIQGDFTNQNLPEILEIICKTIEADYEHYKDQIIITGEGCPPNNKTQP